jgi:hypothetical protein
VAKKSKVKKEIDHALMANFLAMAVKFQRLSRCECPIESKTNAAMARKFLFYVIDEKSG